MQEHNDTTRSDYAGTTVAVCPDCQTPRHGEVHGDDAAGVYGWTCPVCGAVEEPSELTAAFTDKQAAALDCALAEFDAVDSYEFVDETVDVVIYSRHRGGDDPLPADLETLAAGLGAVVIEGGSPDHVIIKSDLAITP